jgi:tetratricopeptide (TPR) repeat protein
LRSEINSLLDAGRLNDAEALLRLRLESVPEVETMLLLAVVLTKQHRYSEAGTLLEETVALDPANAEAHIRRAEYLGRVGLYDQALEQLRLARRYLRPSEVPALLHCQELERWLRERIKSGFVVHPSLPRLPSWLIRSRRGNQAQPLEAR